ncbi:MAG: hypothetical protein ACKOEJ_08300, partial [Acidimicrobiaceae bacterium]
EALRVFGLPAANRRIEHSRFPGDGLEDGVAADRNVACMQARRQMFCVAPWRVLTATVSTSAHWPQYGHVRGLIVYESGINEVANQ